MYPLQTPYTVLYFLRDFPTPFSIKLNVSALHHSLEHAAMLAHNGGIKLIVHVGSRTESKNTDTVQVLQHFAVSSCSFI
jgi:phosphotransferase system IIA component